MFQTYGHIINDLIQEFELKNIDFYYIFEVGIVKSSEVLLGFKNHIGQLF